MYIKRKIESKILRYLDRPEIIALIGPRQAGKTTTLKKIFQGLDKAIFLSFEDRQVLSLFENNIKQFAETYLVGNKFVFIDEFQYAKEGGKLLKYLYDAYPDVKMIISGSSVIDMTIKAIKYLVGRVFVLQMWTFDFYEFLLAKDINYARIYEKYKINLKKPHLNFLAKEQYEALQKYYEEYLIFGGYPQVVITENKSDKQEVIRNIYNTYFLRDVKGILDLADDYKFANLLKSLALQIGGVIEYKSLMETSDTAFHTLKRYLNILSKTYITDMTRPFYTNKRKEIVKNPKVFFFDTGLRNFIVNDFRFLKDRPDAGSLLENGIWMQLVKNNHTSKYWRDRNKNEVDFIVELGESKIVALEVKNNISKCKKISLSFTKNYPHISTYCVYFYTKNYSDKDKIFAALI